MADEPHLAELKAPPASDAPTRGHARKDTRRWCKGKPGREHTPTVVVHHEYQQKRDSGEWFALCRPAVGWDMDLRGDRWICWHVEECTTCGKVLRGLWFLRPEECPDYTGAAS